MFFVAALRDYKIKEVFSMLYANIHTVYSRATLYIYSCNCAWQPLCNLMYLVMH